MMNTRKFISRILCCFIPGAPKRKRFRVWFNNPVVKQMAKFAKSFSDKSHPIIKYTYGFRCANFVVNVDNKWVFKFPLVGDGYEKSIREQRITDALRPISPIKIPHMEIINWNGIYVRKYECISGVGFHSLSRPEQNKHAEKLAKQLAKFLYIVGCANPKEIRDLTTKPNDKPSIMHGWNQNDLWDNFIINPANFNIVGIIDWEDAGFNDFHNCFTGGTGNDLIKIKLLQEYVKCINKNKK